MKTVTIRYAALVGQPLLSVDHLLAGLVVMALLSAGLTALVRGPRAASARED